QAQLVRALPQDFRAACTSLIESWGDIARGTDEWRVRVLARQADQVWLSFRCASRVPEYEKDYDERPALLRLETGNLGREGFPCNTAFRGEGSRVFFSSSQRPTTREGGSFLLRYQGGIRYAAHKKNSILSSSPSRRSISECRDLIGPEN